MRLILSKFFLLILISISAVMADEYECTKGKISQIYFGKILEEKTEYCYNQDKTSILSKSCLEKKCSAFTKNGPFKFSEFSNSIGNPAFHFCRALSGSPEMITFYVEGIPYKLNRCLFSDGSFVNTGTLMSHYMQQLQD